MAGANLALLAYGASGTMGLVGAYSQAEALKAEGKYKQQAAEMEAGYAELKAEDVRRRGDVESSRVLSKAKQLQGAQRAASAAGGVDVNVGSAAVLQADTEALGALDAMTVKNNAWREAWGYKSEAETLRSQGRFARIQAKYGARQTMVTGGLNFARDLALGTYYAKGASSKNIPLEPRAEQSYGARSFQYGNKLRLR